MVTTPNIYAINVTTDLRNIICSGTKRSDCWLAGAAAHKRNRSHIQTQIQSHTQACIHARAHIHVQREHEKER